MAKPIEIGIGSETKAFKQGIESGVIAPLEDAEKALDALGKSKGTAKLEDGMKDAQDATERLADETKQVSDSIDQNFRESYAKVRASGKAGTDGLRGGLKEFKGEAASTARESAASISSVDDAAGALQETLANALGGFGPYGVAIGIAGAIAVGLITSAGEESADAINDAKERTGELAQAIIDAGGDIQKVDIGAMMRDWGVEIADNKEWWELWQSDAVNNLEKAQTAAKATGSDFKTMFRGMSGQDPKAAVAALDALDAQIEKNWDSIRKMQGEDFLGTMLQANGIEEDTKVLERNRDEILRNVGSREAAIEQADLLADATAKETRATEAATDASERHTAALGQINDAYDETAESIEDFVNKETGVFDTAAYITAMGARSEALREYQETLATSGLSSEAIAFIQSQGQEAAATFMAGYKAATPAQKEQLNLIWAESARENSGVYGANIKNALATAFTGTTIAGPTVDAKVKVDRAELDAVMNKSYKVVVKAVTEVFGKPIK